MSFARVVVLCCLDDGRQRYGQSSAGAETGTFLAVELPSTAQRTTQHCVVRRESFAT